MHLTASVVNKLGLARHLYFLALDCLRSHREVALFASVNLMQDAVEAFLLAAAEHLHAGIDSTTGFEKYFQKIEERIDLRTLPFRSKLIALNKVRIAAKHHGVKPDSSEAQGFAVICREFFEESCDLVFGVQFLSVSLIDLLDEGEVKDLLVAAKIAFDERRWYMSMIECRKVIFLEFERQFDIEKFKNGKQGMNIFEKDTSAPNYATEKEHFDQRVSTPFDYIEVDHQRLSSQLIENGIDTYVFWNIWRLTPSVYRYSRNHEFASGWLVKRELKKEVEGSEENAAYVLEHTIDIALHLAQRRRRFRNVGVANYYIRLKNDRGGIRMYAKADRNSSVNTVTEPGMSKVGVDYSTIGLNDKDTYWFVIHAEGRNLTTGVRFYYGFVHEDDVEASTPEPMALRVPNHPSEES